jgi:tetratricopeptide (TPR) repeat protein
MFDLLIALGLKFVLKISIGDVIALAGFAKGLRERISERDASDILKKALNKTINQSKDDADAKRILETVRKNKKVRRELRKLDVNEEAKNSGVSLYFDGRADVFDELAKNYYELFCKEATRKDGTFKEFVVIELGKLASHGIVTNEAVKRVEEHLAGIVEELKRKKEAELRQFFITSDLKEVEREILAGKPQIDYVEREEIEEVREALKTTNKLLVVGKPGAGKSRFLLRILEDFSGCDSFVLIRSFFREDGINSLDAELQELNSFILIWDDLHIVKNELVNHTIGQIEQLVRESGKKYMFTGASRMRRKDYQSKLKVIYYEFKPEGILLEDFRSLELLDNCSAYFSVSVDDGVKKRLLEVGDGTPFYVISLFATSKERGRERLTMADLETLPTDSFELWREHLYLLNKEEKLTTGEKSVLRSIALAMRAVPAIDFAVLEEFYVQLFRGDLSAFDYALNEVVKKFFIGREGEMYSMHEVQAAVVEKNCPPVKERTIEKLKAVLEALEKEKSFVLLWGFAVWFDKTKNYGHCLKFWDVFILKEPNLAAAYNNRGIAYAELKQQERAIEDFDRAITLNPDLAEAYNNRGAAYGKLNQHERAIKDYGKATELNPDYAEAYNNRGIVYAELKQQERAIEDYGKAIALNPNLAEAYNNRGIVYAELKQQERAIEDYGKAIALNPDYAKAYNNRGNAYGKLKQQERAIKDYGKAIALNPNLAEAYNNRGIVYAKLDQQERAIEDYGEAIVLNPDYAEAYSNRGAAYGKLNQPEKAIEDYGKAIALNPNYAEAYGNRGRAHTHTGRYEESARDFKKAGILFLYSGWVDDSVNAYSFCFDLREELENDDVIYCGLALFLITLNADVLIELRRMRIQDETVRKTRELAERQLHNEDISEEIAAMEAE